MSFFDEQPSKPEPVGIAMPDWYGPSQRMIGKPLGDTIVVAHNPDYAVVLTRFVAYPNGLTWDIAVRFASHLPFVRHQAAWDGPDRAMFGIQCADGTGVHLYQHEEWPPVSRPPGFVLQQGDGSGSDHGMTFGLWLNPLPDEPFQLIFAWKAGGIEEIKAEVDLTNLAENAAQALILWPAELSGGTLSGQR